MRRPFFCLFAAALLALPLLAAAPITPPHAAAQPSEATWFAYVAQVATDPQPGRPPQTLLRVDETGTVQSFEVSFFDQASEFAFSPDGRYVAYCVVGDVITEVVLWDIAAERPVWTRNFGPSSGCVVSTNGFSTAGDEVVVGIGSSAEIAAGGPRWRLVLLRAANGDVVDELNDQMQAVAVLGLDVFVAAIIVPAVRHVAPDGVIFTLPHFTNAGGVQAYRWMRPTDRLATIDHWGQPAVHYLPATGELLWLDYPPDAALRGYGIWLADAAGARLVYADPAGGVEQALFIDDGRRILARLAGTNAGTPLVLVARDGTLTKQMVEGAVMSLAAAPGGYVRLRVRFTDKTIAPLTYVLELVRNETTTVLWSLTETDPPLRTLAALVFSLPTPAASALTPFQAVSSP